MEGGLDGAQLGANLGRIFVTCLNIEGIDVGEAEGILVVSTVETEFPLAKVSLWLDERLIRSGEPGNKVSK